MITLRISFLIFVMIALSSCSTNAPLESLYYNAEESKSQRSLIIFLRGRGGSHKDFATEGFIDSVKKRNLPYDMVAPNAHFGYYFGETLVERLKSDLIEPAKEKGYENIFLVGASMGGLGAIIYSRYYPEDVTGVYVISPFLGYKKIIGEIVDSGGLQQWQPGTYDPDDDWQRMVWDWLKTNTDKQQQNPKIYLGYGTEDTYLQSQEIFGDALPSDYVITTAGGHTPKTMKLLWDMFLNKEIL